MPTLLPATFPIDLKPAKTHGLAELGVPLNEHTEAKKGKLGEAMQMLEGAQKVGRRYQNLRATLLKAQEGGQTGVKLLLSFELFGDDNTALGAPSALSAQVLAGDVLLAELPLGAPYLPYGCCWYDNHFTAELPLDAYAAADRVVLAAAADEVRLV